MDEDKFRRIEAVGRAEAEFRGIRIDLADQRKLAAVGLEMLFTSLHSPVGEPRPGMIVSEPTGAGKSAAANRLVAMAKQTAGTPPDKGRPGASRWTRSAPSSRSGRAYSRVSATRTTKRATRRCSANG